MVLITGCNSLLGKTLAQRFMQQNIPVRGLDFWKLKDSPAVTEFVEGNILDHELVQGACKGVDTVIHLMDIENSSHYGRRFMKKINVKGTDFLLHIARDNEVKKFVFLSSAKVFGKPKTVPVGEDDAVKPNSAYGRDKLKAEKLCLSYAEKEGMNLTVFRPTTITGPGLDDSMILVILYMALGMEDSNRLYIAGDGSSRFQLVHPDDVADAILLSMRTESSRGKVYNLGSDSVPTQAEEVQRVKELASLNCQVKHITSLFTKILSFVLRPLNISYLRKEHLLFILSNFLMDCDRAKGELGWKPAKDNVQMFVETIKWYREKKL